MLQLGGNKEIVRTATNIQTSSLEFEFPSGELGYDRALFGTETVEQKSNDSKKASGKKTTQRSKSCWISFWKLCCFLTKCVRRTAKWFCGYWVSNDFISDRFYWSVTDWTWRTIWIDLEKDNCLIYQIIESTSKTNIWHSHQNDKITLHIKLKVIVFLWLNLISSKLVWLIVVYGVCIVCMTDYWKKNQGSFWISNWYDSITINSVENEHEEFYLKYRKERDFQKLSIKPTLLFYTYRWIKTFYLPKMKKNKRKYLNNIENEPWGDSYPIKLKN